MIEQQMASQGLGLDQCCSRDEPAVEATAPLTKGGIGVWHYRGWIVSEEPDGQFHGVSENYDASYEGPEDGWVDNGEKVSGPSLVACCDEIDAWIDEAEEAERAEERANHDGVEAVVSQALGGAE